MALETLWVREFESLEERVEDKGSERRKARKEVEEADIAGMSQRIKYESLQRR